MPAQFPSVSVESLVDDTAFAEGEQAVWDDALGKLVGAPVGPTYAVAAAKIASDRLRLYRKIATEKFLGVDMLSIFGLGGTATGTTTNASNQVTLVSNLGIANGDAITGTGIPAGTTVTAGGGTATLTLSANATASASGVTLTFTHPVHQIERMAIYEPFVTDTSTVTRTGTWTGPTANAGASGGGYYYSTTAGDKASATIPTGATKVGVRTAMVSNGGFLKVVIGGDATRANLLPTAQSLVTDGRLAALGALNATDRILDTYALNRAPLTTLDPDRHFPVADGAGLGGATIELYAVAEKNVASSANRSYVATRPFTYQKSTTTRGTPGAQLLPVTRILSEFQTAVEYAFQADPTGSNPIFVGNIHGYEVQAAAEPTVLVDGRAVTLTTGEIVWGDRVEVVRDTALRHPNAGSGATSIATMRTLYRATEQGLDIVWSMLGASSFTMKTAYAGMFPTDGRSFTSGEVAGVTYALTANNGTMNGQAQVAEASVTDGAYVATLELLDVPLSVDNFANASPTCMSIEDRTPSNVNSGNLSKIYATRIGTASAGVAVVSGTQMHSAFRLTVEPVAA